MTRTTYYPSRAAFIVDLQTITRDMGGRQIDWPNVADSYKNAEGKKVLPAGTRVGELLGAGKISPRVVTTNPAFGILETDAVEGDLVAPLSGYGVIRGGHLYENLLPGATGSPAVIASAEKTELAANSMGFLFSQYGDTR
jgi:hypothetical protein